MKNLTQIASAVNEAISGSFIGITDYVSTKGDVSSVTGQIGISYANAKNKAIAAIEKAIAENDFEAVEVKGNCRQCPETREYNSRKRSWPMSKYTIEFTKEAVVNAAKEVLDSYRNAEKKSNKFQLSNKENGLYIEEETGNINISVLVAKQTYKADASDDVKAEKGIVEKVKATMPETALKAVIRKRFEPKIKSFTLNGDNFESLSINGEKF